MKFWKAFLLFFLMMLFFWTLEFSLNGSPDLPTAIERGTFHLPNLEQVAMLAVLLLVLYVLMSVVIFIVIHIVMAESLLNSRIYKDIAKAKEARHEKMSDLR